MSTNVTTPSTIDHVFSVQSAEGGTLLSLDIRADGVHLEYDPADIPAIMDIVEKGQK